MVMRMYLAARPNRARPVWGGRYAELPQTTAGNCCTPHPRDKHQSTWPPELPHSTDSQFHRRSIAVVRFQAPRPPPHVQFNSCRFREGSHFSHPLAGRLSRPHIRCQPGLAEVPVTGTARSLSPIGTLLDIRAVLCPRELTRGFAATGAWHPGSRQSIVSGCLCRHAAGLPACTRLVPSRDAQCAVLCRGAGCVWLSYLPRAAQRVLLPCFVASGRAARPFWPVALVSILAFCRLLLGS